MVSRNITKLFLNSFVFNFLIKEKKIKGISTFSNGVLVWNFENNLYFWLENDITYTIHEVNCFFFKKLSIKGFIPNNDKILQASLSSKICLVVAESGLVYIWDFKLKIFFIFFYFYSIDQKN